MYGSLIPLSEDKRRRIANMAKDPGIGPKEEPCRSDNSQGREHSSGYPPYQEKRNQSDLEDSILTQGYAITR